MYDQKIVERALELSRQGFSDRLAAEMCGVSISAVRKWRTGARRASGRDGRIKEECPRCHERELQRVAYAYLLGLYLGDGHIAGAPGNKGVYRLEIACSDAWPGLIELAAEAVAAVMPGLSVGRRAQIGCTAVGAYSKHWPCLFPQHGPGKKHTRKIALEAWQQEIFEEFTEEFIRGLIHSDGCRSMNRIRRPHKDGDRWYEYPRYYFTNVSLDIQDLYKEGLDLLGIEWKQMNYKTISVARREAVTLLDEFVGPKH
jgi:hypothetical protein